MDVRWLSCRLRAMKDNRMHNGNTLRIIMVGAIAALAVAAPAAVAKPTSSHGRCRVQPGDAQLARAGISIPRPSATPAPPSSTRPASRPSPGNGKGLVNAAANSPALSLCVAPTTPTTPPPGGGDGGIVIDDGMAA